MPVSEKLKEMLVILKNTTAAILDSLEEIKIQVL
jgi:hypothetical protein